VPIGAFKTRDIHIVIDANGDKFWRALCSAIERPEWADDARFVDRAGRLTHVDELMALLQDIFATRPGDEWIERLEAAGVPCGPINTVDRALADPQVLARNMVVDATSPVYGTVKLTGSPIKFDGTDDTEFHAPPALDFHALRRIAMLPSRRPISSVIVEAGRCAHAGAHSMDGGGALQRRGY
jgi:crotonobetainyl-CoA:carnitine CoA-transferase CaiB-like acyl-CoA transferase